MKRIVALILMMVMMLSLSVSVYAETKATEKEEVVYGILNKDGSVSSIYVVNIFNGGAIKDFGNYTEVRNLTTSEKLEQRGDEITLTTTADKLYYQGTLAAANLPWNFSIQYRLNGKEISADDLAGKSGTLEIKMDVKQNDQANPIFFEDYALQITLSLDTRLCDNIQAEGATIANAGSKKQLSYTALPGKGIEFSITADVHDFEMDAITINGIRLFFDLAIDDSTFTEEMAQLVNAIAELDNGAGELLKAVEDFQKGIGEYINVLKAFTKGISELDKGVDQLNKGAMALKDRLFQLSQQNDMLMEGALAMQQAVFDTVNGQLSDFNPQFPPLTPENYSDILAGISELAGVKTQLDNVVNFTKGLKGYTGGVAHLQAGASDLASGTTILKASSSEVYSLANRLYFAGEELNDAVKKLRNGFTSYKMGTNEFRSQTAHLDAAIDSQIDEILTGLMGGDRIISFVSDKNTNTTDLQFVLRADPIEKQGIEIKDQGPSARLNFWQKLLRLFGLY
ncbi:hypothetical protein [Alkaliphilus crotonatoxidans]